MTYLSGHLSVSFMQLVRILGSIRRSIRLSRGIGGEECTKILNIGVSLVLSVP